MAVIGTGSWGRNWVRVLHHQGNVDLAWIVDPNPTALKAAQSIAPAASAVADVRETGDDFDAAVLCTPSSDHPVHATDLLRGRKHLLVEKPLAMSSRVATSLMALARQARVRLMVGHQLLYHPVFTRLQEMLNDDAIGELRSITAERTGPIDLRREHGVLWSYGPHDIAMILTLVKGDPVAVTASGQTDPDHLHLPAVTDINLTFEGGVTAQVHLAASPCDRIRRLRVVGSHGTLTFNDAEPGGTLVHVPAYPVAGERPIPIQGDEPLAAEAQHFVTCVRLGQTARTGPEHALRVIKVLENASASFSARA